MECAYFEASLASKRKFEALPMDSLEKSGCRGLSRKFDSLGTRTLGTDSRTDSRLFAQASPIA
jgi:hypothetical protein